MSSQTSTISNEYLNNSKTISSITTKTVPTVVVDNQVVVDFREVNPGVVNSAYTENPLQY